MAVKICRPLRSRIMSGRDVASLVLLAIAACRTAEPELQLVGSATCAECHATVASRVAGSDHHLAMQRASAATVLGRFDGVQVTYHGVTTEFFQRDGQLLVRTDGPSGAVEEYEVTHTLGVFPLQQYIVAFPDGRYQMLPVAWDTREQAEGGQRWFHLYADEPTPHTDELHWTGPQQTWNYMCAECHVTGLQRNYDLAGDVYATTWNELGVRCESCHGPGSRHVAWARDRGGRDRRGLTVDLSTAGAAWVFTGDEPIARRSEPLQWNAQAETCGLCHSRRETLAEVHVPGRPLLATHRPVLLDEGLYFADGQLLDEVYEYGSFLQSRMYRAGVTCSDCHDAATQQVPAGNVVCAKCHRPDVFDTPTHHFHEVGSGGTSCVGCHMPPRTYMSIDPRHDHSIRVPRPDLSLRIGTPNACTVCHADQSDEWAARFTAQWYGAPPVDRHYGDVLFAGRRGEPAADTALVRLAADTSEAGIVRATAVSLLNRYGTPAATRGIRSAAHDPEPLVRLAAAMASDALAPESRLYAIAHLLSDSLLAIRIEAARVLAEIPDALIPTGQQPAARAAFDEYVAAQLVNAERPESHVRLGTFHLQRVRPDDAERHYREALRIGPRYAPGYANLADLYRLQGRELEGERVLREGLHLANQPGVLHHSLGLLLVRTRRLDDAITELARAVELEPDVPRFAHVYAVALHSVGRIAEAVRVLEAALTRDPHNRDLSDALADMQTP